MHKWLPNLVAKFWLPNFVLYQTDDADHWCYFLNPMMMRITDAILWTPWWWRSLMLFPEPHDDEEHCCYSLNPMMMRITVAIPWTPWWYVWQQQCQLGKRKLATNCFTQCIHHVHLLSDTKPLSEPMVIYCQLYRQIHTSVKFQSNYKNLKKKTQKKWYTWNLMTVQAHRHLESLGPLRQCPGLSGAQQTCNE